MNQFIVLEGSDGSGKTTVGKLLAESMGAEYMKTPGEEYKASRLYIDSNAHPDARLLFYLSSVVDASNKIAQILPEKPVVCDRYVWSSLIPHSVYYHQPLNAIEAMFEPVRRRVIQPSHTILLQVDESEQRARITHRSNGIHTASDKACLNGNASKLREVYEKIALRDAWVRINTTHKSIDAVMDEVTKFCNVPLLT